MSKKKQSDPAQEEQLEQTSEQTQPETADEVDSTKELLAQQEDK